MDKLEGIKEETWTCVAVSAFFCYEPRNATRYDVVMTDLSKIGFDREDGTSIAIVVTNHQRGCAVPAHCNNAGYLAEKLRMGMADAEALLPLLRYFVENT